MDVLAEDAEYSWREVILPSLVPVVPEPELERVTGERRRGRDVLVAVHHGPNSQHAFHWAVSHFCRLAGTLHLVHVVSSEDGCSYKGDAGKVICREAERLKPAAVVVGTRGRGFIQSVLQGSVSATASLYPSSLFRAKMRARHLLSDTDRATVGQMLLDTRVS